MSYIVHQKIHGRTYAYECVGRWDKEKKQARQTRRYLGAVDEHGNIVPKAVPKASPQEVKVSKDYGHVLLLLTLAEQEGVRSGSRDAFGEDGDTVLALSVIRLIDPTAMRNVHLTLEGTFLPEMLGLGTVPSSQRISELLSSLGSGEAGVRSFLRSLARKEDALAFDLTSLSSYSRQLPFLEYGADYRETHLPQINLGLVVSVQRHLPIYYKAYPGSVSDVSTLKNLLAEVKDLGVEECLLIMDRGFYSQGNVEDLSKAKVDFVMPLPFGNVLAKELISQSNRQLDDPDNGHMLDKELYFVRRTEVKISKHDLHAFLIMSEKRRAEERKTVFSRLEELENKFAGKEWHPGMPSELAEKAGNLRTCLNVRNDNGTAAVVRKRNAISQMANRCGKMILLSSKEMSWKEAISVYRQRDEAEGDFSDLKTELQALPLRVASEASFRGLLFILFLSLLLRSHLLNRAKKAQLPGKMWTGEMLKKLGQLKVSQVGREWRVNEVTKGRRELFEALGVGPPVTGEVLVIKEPGV